MKKKIDYTIALSDNPSIGEVYKLLALAKYNKFNEIEKYYITDHIIDEIYNTSEHVIVSPHKQVDIKPKENLFKRLWNKIFKK